MLKPKSVKSLEEVGRTRLSKSFFLRDFLYSEIASVHGLSNIPDDPDLAIKAGRHLCEELLEPLNATFGRIAIRSAYRSCDVNHFGNEHGYNCASNEKNYAGHIWDRRDGNGLMGATACIVIPWFAERYEAGADWRSLAWWIHDHLPYSCLQFFPRLCAFNIQWHETPKRLITSYIEPRGTLSARGAKDDAENRSSWYSDFPDFQTK
ncbi:MAG: hypothetical protein P1U69_16370 [Parvibaculaceae bacterium]|nr:hypothetical protein [Parvibaculaceae bacterium]